MKRIVYVLVIVMSGIVLPIADIVIYIKAFLFNRSKTPDHKTEPFAARIECIYYPEKHIGLWVNSCSIRRWDLYACFIKDHSILFVGGPGCSSLRPY